MQPSPRLSFGIGFDELAIAALATQAPVARPSDAYVHIEIMWDDEGPDDLAVTNRFVRFSAPYERVEIEPLASSLVSLRARATTFARTVRAPLPSVTAAFDKVWFDQPEDAIATIEDVPSVVRASSSWLWLGISLLVAALAVGLMQYAV